MEMVSETLCSERQKIQDERFARDKERIENLEKMCGELKQLSTQMGELLKKYDEQLGEHKAELKQQEERLTAIEQRPLRWWEKLSGAVATSLGAAIGGSFLTILIQR